MRTAQPYTYLVPCLLSYGGAGKRCSHDSGHVTVTQQCAITHHHSIYLPTIQYLQTVKNTRAHRITTDVCRVKRVPIVDVHLQHNVTTRYTVCYQLCLLPRTELKTYEHILMQLCTVT